VRHRVPSGSERAIPLVQRYTANLWNWRQSQYIQLSLSFIAGELTPVASLPLYSPAPADSTLHQVRSQNGLSTYRVVCEGIQWNGIILKDYAKPEHLREVGGGGD